MQPDQVQRWCATHLAVGEPIVARLNPRRSSDDCPGGRRCSVVGKLSADRGYCRFPLGRVHAPLFSDTVDAIHRVRHGGRDGMGVEGIKREIEGLCELCAANMLR